MPATGNENDQSSIINNNNHGITFEAAMQAFYAAQDEEEQQAFYNAQREEEEAAEHPTQACNRRGEHNGEHQELTNQDVQDATDAASTDSSAPRAAADSAANRAAECAADHARHAANNAVPSKQQPTAQPTVLPPVQPTTLSPLLPEQPPFAGRAATQLEECAAVKAQAITRGQQARWRLQQPQWKLQQANDVRALDARSENLMWLARLRRDAGDLEGALVQAARASDSYDKAGLTDLDGAAAARHLEDDILNEITSASPQAHQPIGQLQQTEQSPKPPTLVPPLEPTCHPWSPRATLGAHVPPLEPTYHPWSHHLSQRRLGRRTSNRHRPSHRPSHRPIDHHRRVADRTSKTTSPTSYWTSMLVPRAGASCRSL